MKAFDTVDQKDYSFLSVITEPSAVASPPEISQDINAVHGQVQTLQRELAQALEVWQATLADEKKKFEDLSEHKVLAAEEQNLQWARQTQTYEERLTEMKSEFDSRLKQTEQNAIRALSELDDAWQRDKLEWGPQARAEWPAQRRELEAKAQALDVRLTEIENAHTVERESLLARIHELENRPAVIAELPAEGPTPEAREALQSLESQIIALHDVISHLVPSDLAQS